MIARALAHAATPRLAARYTFHLALRHCDRGESEAAILRFLERADQGFEREEVYVSLVEAGRHLLLAGRPLAEVLAPLERAMALLPARAEAPHTASAACRIHAEYRRGTRYGEVAAATPMPGEGLFLEPWIYRYGALDEYAINAYWAGEARASLEAGLRALASGTVPEDQRARFLANARFALDRLAGGTKIPAAGADALAAPRALDAVLPEPAPRVLLAILAGDADAALPLFLDCLEALDYPKSAIVLHVRCVGGDRTRNILESWLARVAGDYAGLDRDGAAAGDPAADRGRIKDLGLAATARHGCAYYFTAECDNLIRPCTLRHLVATGLPIVAPLLRHVEPAQLFSNFHAAVDEAGYFRESNLYEPVLFQHVIGLLEMPVVRSTYLVRADVIPRLGHTDGTAVLDYVVFSRRARAAGISQYLDNRQVYGTIAMEDADPAVTEARLRQARRLMSREPGPPAAGALR